MKNNFILWLPMAVLPFFSCNKYENLPNNITSKGSAEITLSIQGLPSTKSGENLETTAAENSLNTLEIFVFSADEGQSSKGLLEAYKKIDGTSISGEEIEVEMSTSVGVKHIYVIGNSGQNSSNGSSALSNTIDRESALLSAISEFSDNSLGDFIMVGSGKSSTSSGSPDSYSPELAPGKSESNNITVELRRLVSRVKIGKIKADFSSVAVQSNKFVIKRIYLMNVAKQAKYVNGNHTDVFGVGSTFINYPQSFAEFTGKPKYYYYNLPTANSTAANGVYNWANEATFTEGSTVSLNEETKTITSIEYNEASAVLYAGTSNLTALQNNELIVNKALYAYPNSSLPADSQDVSDLTTKLIVETEYTPTDGSPIKYYYPISIPFMEPNYSYNIDTIVIHRLGATTPFRPVSTATFNFGITVTDLQIGEIIGKFNNMTENGVFEI